MVRKAAKSRQKPPKKQGLYTPKPVTARVMVRHVQGQSNRQIAREEGMDRETVRRILSQEEANAFLLRYQARLVQMLPKVAQVLERALDSKDLRVALAAAAKLMPAVREFSGGEYERVFNNAGTLYKPEQEEFMDRNGEFVKRIWDRHFFGAEPLPGPFRWMEEAFEIAIKRAIARVVPSDESKTR